MTTTLDTGARYTVNGYRGVAFSVLGWVQETPEPQVLLVCEDPECEHQDEDCYAWSSEEEPVDSDTMVRAVMVGDDTEHIVDVSDLTKISADDYCHECGQVGCTATKG